MTIETCNCTLVFGKNFESISSTCFVIFSILLFTLPFIVFSPNTDLLYSHYLSRVMAVRTCQLHKIFTFITFVYVLLKLQHLPFLCSVVVICMSWMRKRIFHGDFGESNYEHCNSTDFTRLNKPLLKGG
eukprot:TRINITY_DN3180_c0_g1_i10.p1 TRINITY_DN3180_c0_g1~~TRINITY_DN3180_c0_g1_i10.p1  ORF type:complete len:129 (-),score=5.25 TRINITY_DN3180_c0_g1_i10:164-550(-)